MNDVLHLKGQFEQKANGSKPGAPTLAAGKYVTANHLIKLRDDLIEMCKFWENQSLLPKALVTAYYNKIAAKSNRINAIFSYNGLPANDTIVGAKYNDTIDKHIITHYVSLDTIYESTRRINEAIKIVEKEYNGKVIAKQLNDPTFIKKINFSKCQIGKTMFQQIIVDASFVESFGIEESSIDKTKDSIITLYKTDQNIKSIMDNIGVKVYSSKIIDETSVLLDPKQIDILYQKAPYLIAMSTYDFNKLSPTDFEKSKNQKLRVIPTPTIEPTIGVIDTLFDEEVYFKEWVTYKKMISDDIQVNSEDYLHGTSVSSIIVDGPSLNPDLDDGCGRFKVRHFGVSLAKGFSSFTIVKQIKEIITSNSDIRVWNLSLGSYQEIHKNFISIEASSLDEIQYENDVIFVISATNKNPNEEDKKIGYPADSINSVVVSSVDYNKKPTNYSRTGIVLSYFLKPDVSYYGGSSERMLVTYNSLGEYKVSGTSYAAPWIARKLSYLIDILGFNREVAKAMIIDSAIGWEDFTSKKLKALKGYGVVPIHIKEIVSSPKSEIKFVLSGISEKYDTYNYNFPVPIYKNQYPYLAKATLCYFPKCTRSQGVDYTNTELDIYFGRINDKNTINSINRNTQSIEDEGGSSHIFEKEARSLFQKWDNVKHIRDVVKKNNRTRTVYEKNKNWGMSIKTKERLNGKDGEGIRFGVVVTLKEINGINRIDDFIQSCSLRGWLVNRINVENKIDIYQTANEDIEFE